MNTSSIQSIRAVSIIAQFFRGGRCMLPGAVLACAMGTASSALAMGNGLSPGLFELPPGVGDRALLACDTDAAGELNGCNAESLQYLAVPVDHVATYWNNGQVIEAGVTVQGMQTIGIVGMENAGSSFDQVCVTVVRTGGPPTDRGKLVCVEIVPEGCPGGSCSTASSCSVDGATVHVESAEKAEDFCTAVEDELQGYAINGLAYVVAVNFPRAGESGSTTIRKCANFAHRCAPFPGSNGETVTVKGSRHTALVETPHYTGGYIGCRTC